MSTMTHSQLIELAARGNAAVRARAAAELARRASESSSKAVL